MIEILETGTLTAQEIRSAVLQEPDPAVERAVDEILREVQARGDAAVREYTLRFDGSAPENFRVPEEAFRQAVNACGEAFCARLRQAADNIRFFHQQQKREGFTLRRGDGILMGQRVLPLDTVGLYIPGGRAAYPSSVLMNAIPAAIAGVRRIVMVTPPGKNGKISDAVLAAAHIAGVTDVFAMGGAQAVAALAFGTETVPRVDKIVGPGNIYVATAKRKVFGLVDIDMVAGPSEVLILADETAVPAFVAADMLAQAEHDPMAQSILVSTERKLAEAVQKELERQLDGLSRPETARASILKNGRIIMASDVENGIKIANMLAPEHLALCVADPFRWLEQVKNAGSIFLGNYAPEALGDYWAGPNHTLPTSGAARFASPLSVDEFVKRNSFLFYGKEELAAAAAGVAELARAEGLEAHARSVEVRCEEEGKQ